MDRDLAAASQQRESSQRYEDGLGASPAAQPSPQRPILDVPEPDVPELMRDLFSKIGTLLEGELQAGGEDFTLLEQMNLLTTNKYREMAQYASGLVAILDKLRERRAEIQPSLDAIDRVDESVRQLEEVATKLDEYTKLLEKHVMEQAQRR